MIVDCISDLHGYHPEMEGGDLLIIAGDLTTHDKQEEYDEFREWVQEQNYTQKIFIAGNHDNHLKKYIPRPACVVFPYAAYLFDSGCEFEGLKIWGSPWTKKFEGINPKFMAFTVDTDEELEEKWELMPEDVDILVTHCPPYGVFDSVSRLSQCRTQIIIENTGSEWLSRKTISNRLPKLKLHIFGHIHEHGGKILNTGSTKFINASHVDAVYDPVHKPVRVIL